MLGVGVKDVGHVTMNEKLGRELKMAEGTMRRSKFEALIEWCWIGKSRLCCTYHFILESSTVSIVYSFLVIYL